MLIDWVRVSSLLTEWYKHIFRELIVGKQMLSLGQDWSPVKMTESIPLGYSTPLWST